ncbi:MAG: ABC transporter ATP-binding protein [Pyrinomonadaceae bacterium]
MPPEGFAPVEETLVASGLCKAFAAEAGARVEVLRGVSLTIAAGEMVAITGASGAGKSTLLNVLGGLEKADAGQAHLCGFEITLADAAQLARFRQQHVGFVFQFHHLLQDLTALENVALPLRIARLPPATCRQRAMEILESVNLREHARQPVSRLSGGEQQRVALARAVVKNPRLVLADEPTGNLDAVAGAQIGRLLKTFARTNGACVVLATHNENLVALCDRALRLCDGKLETTLEPTSGGQAETGAI